MRRHRFLWLVLLMACFGMAAFAQKAADGKLPVAALLGSWHTNSHADVIVGRILKTYMLDGQGVEPQLRLVSMHVDSPRETDFSARLAEEYNILLANSMEEALTLGTGTLAVGGVILCSEHGIYPRSELGQIEYQHRRMFDEIVKVFRASGKVVPVFIDKHLAENWEDSLYIYRTAQEMKIPLMAGSSVPGAWRIPAADVHNRKRLREIVGISYGSLDSYGFHGLEMVQSLAEQRLGGERGVQSVQFLEGPAVWEAAGTLYDPDLLAEALERHDPPLTLEFVKGRATQPVLFVIHYSDGLRATVFTLNRAVRHWASAWRYAGGETDSALFWLDDSKHMLHFALQMAGIEKMFLTGAPPWPAERTLLSSGILHFCLVSKAEGYRVVETPEMSAIRYPAFWKWSELPIPDLPKRER